MVMAVICFVVSAGAWFIGAPWPFPLLLCGGALVMVWKVRKRSSYTRRVFGGLLNQGRCPACDYEIFGLESEADGCIVCPECGGAWRVLRRR